MAFQPVHLLMVLLLAWSAGLLAKRFHIPAILGELGAGVVFGPAMLGILDETAPLQVLSQLGLFLMMLYIGLEVDYRAIRNVSKPGVLAAIGGFVLPFMAGYGVGIFFSMDQATRFVIGLILSTTSLAVISRVLADLKILGTRLGQVIFVGALVCDVLALLGFAIISSTMSPQGLDWSHAVWTLLKACLFFGGTIFVGVRLFPLLGQWVLRIGGNERTANFTLLLVVATVFAELAEIAGLHSMIGAFLTGLFIREEVMQRKLSHEITSLVHDLSLGFLAPIFFVTAGFHVDLSALLSDPGFPFWLFLVGTLAKVFGVFAFYFPAIRRFRESISIGVGMSVHGAVEIIIASIAFETQLIDQHVFSALIVMVFASTMVAPVCLKIGVNWLRHQGQLARADQHRKGLLIVGATPLAIALAKYWYGFEGVRLVDTSQARCQAARQENLDAFQGNALREETLNAVRAGDMRVFLAMTGNADVNRIACKMAAEVFGVPDIHRIRSLREISDRAVTESGQEEDKPIFGIHFVPDTWNLRILRGETRLEEIRVPSQAKLTDVMTDWSKNGECLPVAIARKGQHFLPGALNVVEAEDRVTLIRYMVGRDPLEGRFEELVRNAPILDFQKPTTADEIFERISHVLSERLQQDWRKIFELFRSRERESSTVIMPGLALPHILIEGKERTEIVLARCVAGLSVWGTETRVQTVFVIAGTRDQRTLHLRILSAIAQLCQDTEFESRWMAAQSVEELRSIILATKKAQM